MMGTLKPDDSFNKYAIENLFEYGGDYVSYHACFLKIPSVKVTLKIFITTDNAEQKRLLEQVQSVQKSFANDLDGMLAQKIMLFVDWGIDKEQGLFFTATDYTGASTLRQRLEQHGPLSLPETLWHQRRTAENLAYMHQHGLVHKNVHSGNVFIQAADGEDKLIISEVGIGPISFGDYGLDAAHYLSRAPEQLHRYYGEITPATDTHGCVSMMYEMLTGQRPFKNGHSIQSVKRHILEDMPNLHVKGIPPATRDVFRKGFAKLARDRFATPSEFLEAFEYAQSVEEKRKMARRIFIGATLAGAVAAFGVIRPTQHAPVPPGIGTLVRDFNANGVHDSTITLAIFSSESRLVASAGVNGRVVVQDARTGNVIFNDPIQYQWTPIVGLAFLSDGRLVTVGASGRVSLWATDGRILATYHLPNGGNALALSPTGNPLLLSNGVQVIVVDNPTNFKNQDNPYRGHTAPVNSLATAQNGQLGLSGSDDASAQLWLTETATHQYTYTGHTREVSVVVLLPGGQIAVTGSEDKSVQGWSIKQHEMGKLLFSYCHTGTVRCAGSSTDGRMIASGSDDKRVIVYDIQKHAIRYTYSKHTDPVTSAAYSADGQYVLSAAGKQLHLWKAV